MRISKIFMAIAASVMLFSACAPTQEQKTDEAINSVLNEFQAVGIAAAVVKNGEIVYNKSFGYKDLENRTPLANDNVMRIASISKSFTATSLMRLPSL